MFGLLSFLVVIVSVPSEFIYTWREHLQYCRTSICIKNIGAYGCSCWMRPNLRVNMEFTRNSSTFCLLSGYHTQFQNTLSRFVRRNDRRLLWTPPITFHNYRKSHDCLYIWNKIIICDSNHNCVYASQQIYESLFRQAEPQQPPPLPELQWMKHRPMSCYRSAFPHSIYPYASRWLYWH